MNKRRTRISTVTILLLFVVVSILFLVRSRPPLPKVKVNLWDGSHMTLVDADSGHHLCYGGNPNEKLLSKLLGHDLPPMFRNRPIVWKSFYTNGIGLLFRREENGLLTNWWNGSGQIYLVENNGRESIGRLRGVCFNTDPGAGTVASEDLSFDFPFTTKRDLHFRLYETNTKSGVISTNDFRMPNPVL